MPFYAIPKGSSPVIAGSGAPASGLGNVGDLYIDTTAKALYGPKLSTGWGSPTSLVGATGATGPQGPAGPPTTDASLLASGTLPDARLSSSVVTVDGSGKVPSSLLPSYVDDVVETASTPTGTGETGKIYVALDTGKCYRWSGSVYVEVSPSSVASVAGKTGVVTLTASDCGAAAASHTHTLSEIADAGTAAAKAVPASGNASSTQVVLGSDTRLTDSRAPTSHAHGSITNQGTIGSGDEILVTIAGGAITTASSLAETQTYISDLSTSNIQTDDYLGGVISSIDGALTYTNGQVSGLNTTVSSLNSSVSALQTADTYTPGYDGVADANDWASRVSAQSASVSTATRAAVTRFCVAIAAAGLRSKIWRANVFAGNTIAAAMVPIYRGPSRSGTQYGGTIDTNNNFSSASWTEAGGLVGNGSTRYLTLGTFAELRTDWATGHLGIDYTGADATARYIAGGFFNEGITSPRGWYTIWGSTSGFNGAWGNPTKFGFTQAANLKVVNRSSSTSLWFYESGERVVTETVTANTSTVQPGGQFCVMAASYTNVSGGVPTTSVNGYQPAVGTCRGYTIGDALTQFQAYAFGAAWLRLQQELGRA